MKGRVLAALLAVVVVVSIATVFGHANVVVFPALYAQPVLSQSAPCDLSHVVRMGKVWQVLPTGTNDTANLQCAFDQAVAVQGSTVLLASGTYYTGQVVVSGFRGSFRGRGMDQTIIKTLDRPLRVTYLDFQLDLPTPESGSNPWPSIFAFVGGDILVSDLSLYATENSGTTGWTFTGLGVDVYELAHGFVVVGSEVPGQSYRQANAALYRVHVEGLPREGSLYGYNLINASYYEGFLGADALPLQGTFDVHDSEFRQVGGTNLFNLYDAQVSITGNTYSDSFEGMDIGYLVNTAYTFAHNTVLNISSPFFGGLYLYGSYDSSTLSIGGNAFTGVNGIFFDDTVAFSGDMNTRLLKNSVQGDSGLGIYLSPGTTDALVVCSSPKDTVDNLGTDNRLVACQERGRSSAFVKGLLPEVPRRRP